MESLFNLFLLLDFSVAALQALRKTSIDAADFHRYCFNRSAQLQHWSEIQLVKILLFRARPFSP